MYVIGGLTSGLFRKLYSPKSHLIVTYMYLQNVLKLATFLPCCHQGHLHFIFFSFQCASDSEPVTNEHERVKEFDAEVNEASTSNNDEETSAHLVLTDNAAVPEYISLSMHDYNNSLDLNLLSGKNVNSKEVQTDPVDSKADLKDASTQTETVSCTCHIHGKISSEKSSVNDCGCQTNLPCMVLEDIKDSDEKLMFYTGIPNHGTFNALFDEVASKAYSEEETEKENKGGRPRCLRLVDEFFLVLMRFRLGLLIEDLCDRFYISKTTCANVINHWIGFLSVNLSFLIPWPDKETNSMTMPSQFQSKYPRCRAIVDCTEIYTETPHSLANKSLMFSHYKSHMTWKALLAINPKGVITFVSNLWVGSTSDKQIFIKSGILDLLEPGDQLMVDKGFQVSDFTTPRGIDLIIPPFRRQGKFSRREVEETRRIANLRIHVERANERVKNFRILQGNIPITLSKSVSNIFKICAALSNLQPPLVN